MVDNCFTSLELVPNEECMKELKKKEMFLMKSQRDKTRPVNIVF